MKHIFSRTSILIILLFITTLQSGVAQTWNGLWMKDKNNTLTITNETKKTFHFSFITNNAQDIQGDAAITGTTAIYKTDKQNLKFNLTTDTSAINLTYQAQNGKFYTVAYKLSYDDFFKRLNKETEDNPTPAQATKTVSAKTTTQSTASEKSEFLNFFKTFVNSIMPQLNKKVLPTLINYPLEIKHDGILLTYNQKKLAKDLKNIFKPSVCGEFFIQENNKFDSFTADPSWNGLGIQTGNTIFTVEVNPPNEIWSYFKIFVTKIKNEYKIVTIETD